METNEITRLAIGADMRVHTELGPGLLESTDRASLCHELQLSGLKYEVALALRITYNGNLQKKLGAPLRQLGAPRRSECFDLSARRGEASQRGMHPRGLIVWLLFGA